MKKILVKILRRLLNSLDPPPDTLTHREFFYIDEISVVSLLSSLKGGLPDTWESNISSQRKLSINSPKIPILSGITSTSGGYEGSQARALKYAYTSNIQAHFKSLHEALKEKSLIKNLPEIDSSKFEEGDFFELKVNLRVSNFSKIDILLNYFSTMSSLWPEGFEENHVAAMSAAQAILKSLGGSTYTLEADIDSDSKRPLVVAHLEKEKFQQPPELVMTAGRTVSILCRVRSDKPISDWERVPLQNFLAEYGFNLEELMFSLESAFKEGLNGLNFASPIDPPLYEENEGALSQVDSARQILGLPAPTPTNRDLPFSNTSARQSALPVDVIAIYW